MSVYLLLARSDSMERPIIPSRRHISKVERNLTTVECRMCKKSHQVVVKVEDVSAWLQGAYIQVAMSYLTPDQRELLQSGTCPECWKKLFGDEEEENAFEDGKHDAGDYDFPDSHIDLTTEGKS